VRPVHREQPARRERTVPLGKAPLGTALTDKALTDKASAAHMRVLAFVLPRVNQDAGTIRIERRGRT
tara:strand:- start:538107 stop:538307 length:201 start_codon:yes stop_codon:yes gene_type:complete